MKKAFRMIVFVLIIGITAITLTSGTSRDYNGGDRNLVDELYSQAVKQNDNLESIEDDIERFYKKRDDAMEKYYSFTAYNSRYYTDAREKAATIADAATKQRANDIISKSEAGYTAKLADWQNTIAALNAG
ncbi:MAG TPA: hypothetical protein VK483_04865, partial [Chitinophagaceae bacterium]|nr:hypothetical protein [Chitinophagaceae bacterium]